MIRGLPIFLAVCILAATPLLYPPLGIPAVLALALIWLATPLGRRRADSNRCSGRDAPNVLKEAGR